MDPYLNHPQKEIIEISPNLIEIPVAYRFPMGSWSGMDSSTLTLSIPFSDGGQVVGVEN